MSENRHSVSPPSTSVQCSRGLILKLEERKERRMEGRMEGRTGDTEGGKEGERKVIGEGGRGRGAGQHRVAHLPPEIFIPVKLEQTQWQRKRHWLSSHVFLDQMAA